jgi:heptosyltransferase-3
MLASAQAPDSILVINVSRIGDTLLVTPALRALAAAWPHARLTALGHPKRIEVLQHLPFVAETGAITAARAAWRGRLGGRRWDLALVYGFDKPLVAYALRTARRVAAFRQDDADLDGRLFRCVEKPAFQAEHAALLPLRLTRALGVPDASLRLVYAVTAPERERARALLAARLPAGAAPLVGLQVASFPTKAYRDWPLEHFAALCERIVGRWRSAHLVLLGGELDRERNRALAARFPGRASSFAGELSLRESAALMDQLDLYVGVDTGPTHIMGALARPMVALYHCYSPSRLLRPLERERCYVVDHPRAPEGCTPQTPMAEIGVDTVWDAVRQALAASSSN